MSKKEFIFGFHAIEAILHQAPQRILQLYSQTERQDKRLQAMIDLAKVQHIPVQNIVKTKLDQWTQGARHQGLVAEVRCVTQKTENDLLTMLGELTKPALLLVLDEVHDPHNLGACLRSANAAGVDAVIIPQDRSVRVTPTVRKVAAGAAEVTPVMSVTNLAHTLRQLKKQGLWVYGLDADASQSLYTTDVTGSIALVLGAEGKGLRHLTRTLCDGLLAIPMYGCMPSLNVSVAAGICLFEVLRQRHQHDK